MFYKHASAYVLPIDPQNPGTRPGRALLAIAAVCTGVLVAWNMAASLGPADDDIDMTAMGTDDQAAVLRQVLSNVSPAVLAEAGRRADWMSEHFTVNSESVLHRPWTLVTSSLSHQDPGHLLGNLFSLFLFMPKTYAFLGPRHFLGLWVVGAIGCGLAHAAGNRAAGRTEPPFGFADSLLLSAKLGPEEMEAAMAKVDMPSLGASGSCMAVAAASAMLFPRDQVMLRGIYVSIPLAATMFVVGDLLALHTSENTGVAHSGHVGGILGGAAYLSFLWFSKYRSLGTLPILQWLRGKPNPVVAHIRK
jgi:membrane associated rhomboid family serine protease